MDTIEDTTVKWFLGSMMLGCVVALWLCIAVLVRETFFGPTCPPATEQVEVLR